jgi:hypothetical protein
VAETAHPRRRDYFKPDFFNGIGHEERFPQPSLNGRYGFG